MSYINYLFSDGGAIFATGLMIYQRNSYTTQFLNHMEILAVGLNARYSNEDFVLLQKGNCSHIIKILLIFAVEINLQQFFSLIVGNN